MILATLLALPCLFLGLGAAPFDDPGEGMHAEIARELAVSGNPVELRLGGVRYVDKPPLLYLLLGAAFAVGGPSEAAARAVSALAAVVAVAATAWLGARLLDTAAGIIAGAALLTGVAFFAYGRYVRPESLFVAALAAGFALALAGIMEHRRGLVVWGLAAFGVAGLAKDPLGALLPPLAIGAALGLAGQARPLRRWLPAAGVVLALLLGLGWWGATAIHTPGVAWYTVVDNHVLNVARARLFPDEDVPLSATQFLLVAVAGIGPWALAASVTVVSQVRRRAWRHPREAPWTALALWAVGVLALTALSPFRLPHYGLPASFAVALLAARGWREHASAGLIAAHAALFAGLALTCAWLASGDGSAFVGSVMAATDVATRKAAAVGQESALPAWQAWRGMLTMTAAVLALGALATAALAAVGRREPRRALVGAAVVILVTLGVLPAVAASLSRVSSGRAVRGLAAEVTHRAGADDIVAVEGPLENAGAFEWYAGRRPVIVDGRRSVLGFGATFADAAPVFWDAARLREVWPGARRIWLVTGRDTDRSVVGALPGARLVARDGGRRLFVNR
jgi:4-amino-4-deoxy-L-arabinose transferase-like glycosyltransferase